MQLAHKKTCSTLSLRLLLFVFTSVGHFRLARSSELAREKRTVPFSPKGGRGRGTPTRLSLSLVLLYPPSNRARIHLPRVPVMLKYNMNYHRTARIIFVLAFALTGALL